MRLLSGASHADIEERRLFSEWVLPIGDGKVWLINDVDISLHIPPDLLIFSGQSNTCSNKLNSGSDKRLHVRLDAW